MTFIATHTLWITQALVSAFLAILFLQSGLDKVFDWRGNLEYLTAHFSKSPLASTVKPMTIMITLLEVSTGIITGSGCVMILLGYSSAVAEIGAVLGATSLTALFFGQRVAKDYAGAAVLVPYFILAIVAIAVLGGATPV